MPSMQLKVLLPSITFADKKDVVRIVAETQTGAFGLLPQRLDCVAALVPGILIYETAAQGECFIAVDEGVLVKAGLNVWVSVRRALHANTLEQLQDLVTREFIAQDKSEQDQQSLKAKLEAGFLQRFASFQHEQ